MSEGANGIFGKLDDCFRVMRVLLDGGGRVKDGSINQDAHLICSEVQENLETVDCARGSLG